LPPVKHLLLPQRSLCTWCCAINACTLLSTLCRIRLLEHVPLNVVKLSVKDEFTGKTDQQVVETPTELGVDLAQYILMVSEGDLFWVLLRAMAV
jgi:hypothetical protein